MARITPLDALRLSTDNLPLHERFPFWREVFGQSIVRTDFDTVNSRPFRATATLHAFDDLGIAVGTTAGLRASRSKSLLADGADDLIILVNLAGSCLTSHREGDLEVGAGEAIMRTSAEVGSTIFPGPNRILNLRIPRRVMAARMAAPEDALMRRIPANTEALRLLINYVVTTVEAHQIATADLRQLFATHVHDLVAMTIGAGRDATELAGGRGLRAARLNAIRADINAHLSDEQLTIAAIARRHRVSPRYIQLLFEAEGSTFSEYVLEQRLARAYRMLSASRFSGLAIGAIALEVGFSNLSYFNRTFRRRYGGSPSEIRGRAHAAD
jgi:AraC-like DNA-binding protein